MLFRLFLGCRRVLLLAAGQIQIQVFRGVPPNQMVLLGAQVLSLDQHHSRHPNNYLPTDFLIAF